MTDYLLFIIKIPLLLSRHLYMPVQVKIIDGMYRFCHLRYVNFLCKAFPYQLRYLIYTYLRRSCGFHPRCCRIDCNIRPERAWGSGLLGTGCTKIMAEIYREGKFSLFINIYHELELLTSLFQVIAKEIWLTRIAIRLVREQIHWHGAKFIDTEEFPLWQHFLGPDISTISFLKGLLLAIYNICSRHVWQIIHWQPCAIST